MKRFTQYAAFCLIQGLVYLVLALIPVTPLSAANDKFDPVDDHLIPVEYRFDQSYQKLISTKLFVTRANLQIVTLPAHATKGESVVALCFECQATPDTKVTVTRADRSFWSATFGQDPKFTKGPAPKISRCDAPIPTPSAEAIFKAVKKMVNETRPLRNRNNVVILDSTDTVFSIEANGRQSQGLLTPYASGKNGAAMRRLADLLQQYCASAPSHRAALLKGIETEARNLTQ